MNPEDMDPLDAGILLALIVIAVGTFLVIPICMLIVELWG